MFADAKFLFVICQVGAESALKGEMSSAWPELRFAFSRPGFVTFKLPASLKLAVDFDPACTLAYGGFSWERFKSNGPSWVHRLCGSWWTTCPLIICTSGTRDAALPGDREFEPGNSPLAEEVGRIIRETLPPIALNHLNCR